jgi:hypothetical protein
MTTLRHNLGIVDERVRAEEFARSLTWSGRL